MDKLIQFAKDLQATGLDFAEARYYNGNHGRFTAVDPLLASGKSANPQTFNRYVYSMNRPLILTDPSGMQVATQPQAQAPTPHGATQIHGDDICAMQPSSCNQQRDTSSEPTDPIERGRNKEIPQEGLSVKARQPDTDFFHSQDGFESNGRYYYGFSGGITLDINIDGSPLPNNTPYVEVFGYGDEVSGESGWGNISLITSDEGSTDFQLGTGEATSLPVSRGNIQPDSKTLKISGQNGETYVITFDVNYLTRKGESQPIVDIGNIKVEEIAPRLKKP
jgi:RHS repeat-associated protein